MDYKEVHLDEAIIVGISTRTTNKDNKSADDLYKLWDRFFKEGAAGKIPHPLDNEILNIYTDYENEDQGEYTAFVGKRVSKAVKKNLQKGLIISAIPAGKYIVFDAKGRLPECVTEAWELIRELGFDRAYTADFDVYGTKTIDPDNAEVSIYVSIK